VLGGIHQCEGHRQHVRCQQRTPPPFDAAPEEQCGHRGQSGVQRWNCRDQIHAGLSVVDQCSGRLQVQRSPAARGDPLHKLVGTGPAGVHGAQQPAIGDTCGRSEHAARIERTTGHVSCGAAGGRPRRCGRQDNEDDERGERQRDKPADKRRPIASVAEPEQSGDHIRQDEVRHVDGADEHLPPRRLRHLDVLL
jgi:hypothetical protein